MSSAVLMAGYNNKWAVRKYAKIVAEHYGEAFIESGYKPLREFTTHANGTPLSKPLIQFTLEKLFACQEIEDIVIVGHQMLLEQRLGKFIQQFRKPCQIVNQNTKIPTDIIKRFHIKPRKVKYNSIAGNMIKGYVASNAYHKGQHALFVASDSPLTSLAFMYRFLAEAEPYCHDYDIIVPAPIINAYIDKLGRPTLKLLNDTSRQLSGIKDSYGRQGFRLSSLLLGNPLQYDVNTTNTAYNLRKCLNPNVQYKLFKITRGLGYANVYSKYFLRKDLSVKEVEQITSAYFNGRLKILPMQGEKSTYDYDGTEHEYQGISQMLGEKESSQDEFSAI